MSRTGVGRLMPTVSLGVMLLFVAAGCGEGSVESQESVPPGDRSGAAGVTPEFGSTAVGNREAAVAGEENVDLTFSDQAGREIHLPAPPGRIVSLVPAATGIILALGEGHRLVGRTDYDQEPQLAELPSVGGGLHPSLERLTSLEPDLVIRFEGDQDRATPSALERAGIVHMGVRPDRLDDIFRMIELLGAALDVPHQAATLTAQLQEELDSVRARIDQRPPVRTLFLLGGDPPWVAGPGTFIHELVEIAGGRNVLEAGEVPLYGPVSVEAIAQREVDVLLVPEGGQVPTGLRRLEVVRVSGAVQSPGVGLGEAARELSRVLHPEVWQ